jgi:diguanylate cyclase (GGDEF)-like protein/PAS domain S-box-containing protein
MEFLDSEIMKHFMHSAPVNIFFKDTECKYCFVSEICDMVSAGENGSIVGKTDLEVQKFSEIGKMYYEDDKKILATGEGSQYINEFPMEDGESLYFEIKKNAVRNENGNIIGIVGIVDNVTERVRLEKKAEELSMIDGLTGVYNRNYLKYRVEEKKKKLIFPFTVIISDCNYLKKVNDQYGHEYGDILLKIVAGKIPEGSPVIRMGGDEFMILGNGITEEKASELMTNIQESLKQKSKEKIPLSLAMGSYTVQDKDFCFDEICHKADMRMYEDKKRTKADEGVEIIE